MERRRTAIGELHRKGCVNNTHLLAVFKEAVKAEIDTLFMETLK